MISTLTVPSINLLQSHIPFGPTTPIFVPKSQLQNRTSLQDFASHTTPPAKNVSKPSASTNTYVSNATRSTQSSCAEIKDKKHQNPQRQTITPSADQKAPNPTLQQNQNRHSKHELPSDVNPDRLRNLLDGYFDADYICNGFNFGYLTDFEGPEEDLDAENALSAMDNPEAVDAKIDKELKAGRFAGPFDTQPFPNFRVSPLAIREKSTPGEYRLLHNLSYPYNEHSINSNIAKENSTVQYDDINDAIKIVQEFGPGCWMAKSDIASAFRNVPLSPSQYHLTGFKWKNKLYYDKCLPMGLSSSCRIFQRIASGLLFILEKKFGIKYVVNILDDFMFLHIDKSECDKALYTFIALCNYIGIPIALDKTSKESVQIIIFAGIELSSVSMEAKLPEDKVTRYCENISDLLSKDWVPLHQIKSIIGKLQFATSVVRVGKPFLRRLIDLTCIGTAQYNPNKPITLFPGVKKDLELWRQFLTNHNATSIRYNPPITPSNSINLYSDASGLGWAATFGTRWIQGKWPESWKNKNIALLELYPILVIVKMFAKKMQNSNILFHCDNKAIVSVINRQTSRNKEIMTLLRPLVLTLMLKNIKFKSVHIPSKENTLADSLSRFQDSCHLLHQLQMRPEPDPVPPNLQPTEFIP